MKPIALTFLAVLALAFTLPARAEEITLAWDPQPAPPEPGLHLRYRIEQNRVAPWADAGEWKQVAWDIEAATVKLPPITAGPVSFRAFAYIKEFPGIESEPSAVLETKADLPPVEGLRKVKVSLNVSRDGMQTWQTLAVHEEEADKAAFFRAEIADVQ